MGNFTDPATSQQQTHCCEFAPWVQSFAPRTLQPFTQAHLISLPFPSCHPHFLSHSSNCSGLALQRSAIPQNPSGSKVAPAHLLPLLLLCLGPHLGSPTLLGSSAAIPCPDTHGFCSLHLQMPWIPQHGHHMASSYQGEAPLLHPTASAVSNCT